MKIGWEEVMFYVIFKSKLFFVTRIIVTMFKLKKNQILTEN